MLEIQNFSYNDKQVVFILDDKGNPWFDASNVCDILGYASWASEVVEKLKDDDKKLIDREVFDHGKTPRSKGGAQNKWFVSESGLYKLIFRSSMPDAEAFTDRVTKEVLPSIRKTGSYSIQQTPQYTLDLLEKEYNAGLRWAATFGLEGNQAKIAAHNAIKNYYGIKPMMLLEVSLTNPEQERDFNVSDLAKICGYKSAQIVNKVLEELKFQELVRDSKDRPVWIATPLAKQGKFSTLKDTIKKHSDGTPITQLRWLERVLPILKEHKAKMESNVLKLDEAKPQ